jgi:hypothetical protein
MFAFKRSTRATQQLHGFDELCKDQGMIQNSSATIDTTQQSDHFICPHHTSVFDFLQ